MIGQTISSLGGNRLEVLAAEIKTEHDAAHLGREPLWFSMFETVFGKAA